MQTQAWTQMLVLTGLLSCLLSDSAHAQQDEQKLLVNPKTAIKAEQIKSASHAVVQPGVITAEKTIDLSAYKAALGTNVRLTQYDPATRLSKDLGATSITTLRPGEYIAVASDQIQLAPLKSSQGQDYSAFPSILLMANADGSTRNLRVDNYSDGFAWNKQETSFEASISLAVSDMDDPSSRAPLQTPISIKVSGPALVGRVPLVEISRLGFAGEKDVMVRSDGRNDPVAVTMRHEIDPQAPQNIDLPLRRPTLTVSANPPSIAAFGIEATEITINANGTLPAGFRLTLDSDAGTFEPKTVEIGAAGTATTRLWSGGIGRSKVRVLDERFLVSEETVRYVSPVGFLIAMALGAAFGATFIYFWQQHSKGRASIWGWAAAWVFGIGITIAAFAGFDIPQMLDLPPGRAGLVVPAATAFIAAIMVNTLFAALGGLGAKKD